MSVPNPFAGFGNLFKSGQKSSIFGNVVWLLVICFPGFIFSAVYIKNDLVTYSLLILVIAVAIFGMIMYNKILNIDPTLLQSEQHNLEKLKLQLKARKGENKEAITPKEITKPPLRQIEVSAQPTVHDIEIVQPIVQPPIRQTGGSENES